jgi:hypothetical protein
MSTMIHDTFTDLAGRKLGNIEVLNIVRRQPQIAWQCRCAQCGSSWVSSHTLLVNSAVTCPNKSCGRVAPVPTSQATFTRFYAPPPKQNPAPVAARQEPSPAMVSDPWGMQRHLDYLDRQRGRG